MKLLNPIWIYLALKTYPLLFINKSIINSNILHDLSFYYSIIITFSVSKEYLNYLSLLRVYLSNVELSLNSVVFFGLNSKFYTI